MKFKRIFLVVLDSLGCGEAIDSVKWNDIGANTLGHIIEKYPIDYPNLEKMGLLNLVGKNVKTDSYYTKAHPKANGKDTLTGHLELMGIRTMTPFKTFTETGFPADLISELENKTGSGKRIFCSRRKAVRIIRKDRPPPKALYRQAS